MSEGYRFLISIWQPSPDAEPVIERHVAHDRVAEILHVVGSPPVEDGRQLPRKRKSRNVLDMAACWQHIGFSACCNQHAATYDTSLCREIFDWLALDPDKRTSHGTHRPACMIGAIAAYVDRYPSDKKYIRDWCEEYRRHCLAKGKRLALDSVERLYARIAAKNSTDGKEKNRVFFNTFMALKAYCKGQSVIAFSDAPESIAVLIDPTKTS